MNEYPHHPVSPDERIGNAHRAAVLEVIGRALAEGYVDLGEYETRMAAVTEAKTLRVLLAQVADLPPHLRWNPSWGFPRSQEDLAREAARKSALTALILGAVSLPASLFLGAGLVLGPIAITMARKGLTEPDCRTQALAGTVFGLLGVLASIGVWLIIIFGG
jgi:Domain of unknown function (DUF1707)